MGFPAALSSYEAAPVLCELTPEMEYPHLLRDLAGIWSPALKQYGGGSRVIDASGRGRHSTLTSMDPATDWVTSGGYSALDLDGADDFINTPFTLNLANSWTWNVWFRWAIVNNTSVNLLGHGDGSTTGIYLQSDGVGTTQKLHTVGPTTTFVNSATNIPNNEWCLGTVIKNGGLVSVGVNGVFGTATAAAPTNSSAVLEFGRVNYAAVNYYTGSASQISEVIVHNRAMAIGEALDLYRLSPGGIFTPRRRRVFASVPVISKPVFHRRTRTFSFRG